MSLNKASLRKEMLQKRKMLSQEDIQTMSQEIINKLRPFVTGKQTGMFDPIRNEVDLRSLFSENVALPRINGTMTLHQYTGEFQAGSFGIREPLGDVMLVDVVVVPGAVFDLQGYRIGYGGGYYDRYLLDEHLKIGVCFDFQVVDEVPHEDHDIPLDILITEKRIIRWD